MSSNRQTSEDDSSGLHSGVPLLQASESLETEEGAIHLGPDQELPQKSRGFFQANVGLLLVTTAACFYSLMNLTVKRLDAVDPDFPTLEIIIFRMIITYIFGMAYALWTGIPDPWLGPKEVRSLLIARGITGFVALFGVFWSLRFLSLSDTTVLTFLAPLFTAFAGRILLKEVLTGKQVAASAVSLIGVVLIARPSFLFGRSNPQNSSSSGLHSPEERLFGVGIALVGVCGATFSYVILRAIGKRAHTIHSINHLSTQSFIVGGLIMILQRTPFVLPQKLEVWVALVLVGIFGLLYQVFLTLGLQRESAGRGSMGIYSQVLFATFFDYLFFRTAPSPLSFCGALIIISSAVYIALNQPSSPQVTNRVEVEAGLPREPLLERT